METPFQILKQVPEIEIAKQEKILGAGGITIGGHN
jgi:hypothetical protein